MPIELHVIRASDFFICIDADEHLDFEESKKMLQGLAVACRKRGLERAMIDLRDLPVLGKPEFTNAELAGLVCAFRDAGCSRNLRLAVLYRRFEISHFSAGCADCRSRRSTILKAQYIGCGRTRNIRHRNMELKCPFFGIVRKDERPIWPAEFIAPSAHTGPRAKRKPG